jgi:hypothetical protein
LFVAALALGLAAGVSCGNDETTSGAAGAGQTNGPGGSGGGGSSSVGGAGSGATGGGVIPPPPTDEAPCLNQTYECGDLLDNDMDGLIDYQDPDCLGACDDTEDSLYGGIPGQPGPPCKVDCYFDADSGSGNDDCYWDHVCDPFEVAADYYPEPANGAGCEYSGPTTVIQPVNQTCAELEATQSQACLDYCGPLTPNGCDCFGCCEKPNSPGQYIGLGSEGAAGNTECTLAAIDDATLCHPCTPVSACLNDCDPCELCFGKNTLPPECGDPECATGIQACGTASLPPCPAGEYCVTGCCQELPQ